MLEQEGGQMSNKLHVAAKSRLGDVTTSPTLALTFEHAPTARTVRFKAFITKFSDKYESTWDKEEVLGRMDPVQTFKSTKRSISLSWDVVAGNIDEARANMESMSDLASMLYPTYEEGAISSAPLMRVKFANWVTTPNGAGLLGSISGFSFEPLMDDQLFCEKEKVYPKVIQLTCTLDVIHEHKLGYDADKREKLEKKFPYNMASPASPKRGDAAATNPAVANAAAVQAMLPKNQSKHNATKALSSKMGGGLKK